MQKDLKQLKLAAMQAQELVGMQFKKSKLVAFAGRAEKLRKTVKEALKTKISSFFPSPYNKNILNVLVEVSGGIGDAAMSRVLVKKLKEVLPSADIYFCYDSKSVFDTVFIDGKYVKGFVAKRYKKSFFDLVISGCHTVTFLHYDKSRIEKLAPAFLPVLEKGLEMQKLTDIFTNNAPYLDGYGAKALIAYGSARVANLGVCTGLDIKQNDKALIDLKEKDFDCLDKYGLKTAAYITVHQGINTNTKIGGGYLTRSWPDDKWAEFAKLIKQAFAQVKIVQLGSDNVDKFDFADISLLGRTSVRELPYILKKSLLHIDGESGLVHLAHLLDVKCVVLYGPSQKEYLAYDDNINIVSPLCGGCMNIMPQWAVKCVLDIKQEENCMSAITAQHVFSAAQTELKEKIKN